MLKEGSLYYQPKLHALLFWGNPSNLPYICIKFDPPQISHLMIPVRSHVEHDFFKSNGSHLMIPVKHGFQRGKPTMIHERLVAPHLPKLNERLSSEQIHRRHAQLAVLSNHPCVARVLLWSWTKNRQNLGGGFNPFEKY